MYNRKNYPSVAQVKNDVHRNKKSLQISQVSRKQKKTKRKTEKNNFNFFRFHF